MAAGYGNSQSVAQFVDTKAAAVIAAVPVILAILAALFAWIDGRLPWLNGSVNRCVLIVCIVVAVLILTITLIFAGLAVDRAFKTLSPQDTGMAKASLLFPFEPGTDRTFEERVFLFSQGTPTQRDALECYRRQSVRMSQILPIKFSNLKCAIKHLRWFFGCSTLALFLMLLGAAIGVTLIKPDVPKVSSMVTHPTTTSPDMPSPAPSTAGSTTIPAQPAPNALPR